MRPLGFLVADNTMKEIFCGMLERKAWHLAMKCDQIDIDPDDIHVATAKNDSGLYKYGRELLSRHIGKYENMVVMLDAEWQGSPGPAAIEKRMKEHLAATGWNEDCGLVLVLVPEVDVWLWTRTDHTAKALGWGSWRELEPVLERHGWWTREQLKPPKPKEAAAWATGAKNVARSASIYGRIAKTVGIERCSDPSFVTLRKTLRKWFPPKTQHYPQS
ncbi:MAG: hypothetical protein FWD57_03030 [Polyangiaceae bacterium]|nr:hypothetical protein [Polyangiaceae bacterium]